MSSRQPRRVSQALLRRLGGASRRTTTSCSTPTALAPEDAALLILRVARTSDSCGRTSRGPQRPGFRRSPPWRAPSPAWFRGQAPRCSAATHATRSVYAPPMASAELSCRVEKVVGYPPLSRWATSSGASSTRRCSTPTPSRTCPGSGRRRSWRRSRTRAVWFEPSWRPWADADTDKVGGVWSRLSPSLSPSAPKTTKPRYRSEVPQVPPRGFEPRFPP